MSKKNLIFIIPGILLAVAGYFLVRDLYPKSAGRYPFLVLLVAADIYLYISSRPLLAKLPGKASGWLTAFYWSPLALLLVLFGGSFISPYFTWPKLVKLYLPGLIFTGYAAKLLPLLFLIVQDFFYLIRKWTSKGTGKDSRKRYLQYTGAALGTLVLLILLYGMAIGNFKHKVYTADVEFPALPVAFDGLKIVQLSDIHLGSWISKGQLRKVVEKVNSLEPDIFVFTGDMVNYRTNEAFPFEEMLKDIKARYGKYSILGNHDYGDYSSWTIPDEKLANLKEMYLLHKRIGWKLLRNSNEIIDIKGKPFAVIGVENWGSHARYQKYGDIQEAMNGTEKAEFRLLLSHDPTHWEKIVSKMDESIDLTLSGHTHAFQLGIETNGFRWSPSQYIYHHWGGLYQDSENKDINHPRYLYVNRGTGSLGYPGRVGIDAEITLLELKKK